MSADRLIVRGAREHNLKNVSLDLPRNAMIVLFLLVIFVLAGYCYKCYKNHK